MFQLICLHQKMELEFPPQRGRRADHILRRRDLRSISILRGAPVSALSQIACQRASQSEVVLRGRDLLSGALTEIPFGLELFAVAPILLPPRSRVLPTRLSLARRLTCPS